MNKHPQFLSTKESLKVLNVCKQTLISYDKKGLIDTIRSPCGKRLYNIQKFLGEKGNDPILNIKSVCYCRVSSISQKPELENQVAYLKNKYPTYEIIQDIGSGINFKRRGLIKIIDLAIRNELENLVITYKDRLCRIGYDLIEHILISYSNTNIVIEEKSDTSKEDEIVEDILQIITVFSARVHGLRHYKTKLEESLANELNAKNEKI